MPITKIKSNKKLAPKEDLIIYRHVLTKSSYEGYTILDEIDDENYSTITYHDKNGKSFDIYFELSQLNFCCGILEIGELSIDDNFPIEGFNLVVNKLLQKGLTYIVNTNSRDGSVMWEKLLEKNKYFTLVKTFVNKNSNNTIKIWVSNNE